MKIYMGRISEFSEIEYNIAFEMLSEGRKNAVLRMKFAQDRQRTVLGEKLARAAICEATRIAERDIEFARTPEGKPYCVNSEINFNISHSNDMVVCAVSHRKIGIDIEFVREVDLRITRFACTEQDMEFINSAIDEDEKKELFFKLWTAKEAFVKCKGSGIKDLKTVSYDEIKDKCETWINDGYIITVYEE